jgi:phospholipid/cholesterol/gamma-HCH transport system permease protein
MFTSFVESVGQLTIERAKPVAEMAEILARTGRSLARLSFLNHAVMRSLVYELYATSVYPLFMTVLTALVLGSITVFQLLRLLTGLGAYDKIGEYLLSVMLHEIAPVSVAIILMLRSGTAVISELSVMKLHRELNTLEFLGIKVRDYIYLPRMLAFAFAGPTLALIFSFLGLVGSFFILGFTQDLTFAAYTDLLIFDVQPRNVFIVLTKSFFMSVGVGAVAIQRGMSIEKSLAEVPGKLVTGMMFTIVHILLVEVVFLIIT